MPKPKFPNFLAQPVDIVAQKLLGCILVRQINQQKITVRIVETESYDQDDEASHAFAGKTARNETMFGPAGFLYVYFTYGMHYCCNVVVGQESFGAGVLIRAVEPLENFQYLEQRRQTRGKNLTNGPGKLCQALGIDLDLKGHNLHLPPLQLFGGMPNSTETIVTAKRVGITKNIHARKRFYLANNPYVSKI